METQQPFAADERQKREPVLECYIKTSVTNPQTPPINAPLSTSGSVCRCSISLDNATSAAQHAKKYATPGNSSKMAKAQNRFIAVCSEVL